ncbi:MAG: NAD(P)H-flavin reductase [Gammaproteobacteria bacterium]|jgi:NAD(P)H-flavin reductase|nr:NAD(P)H-flavin reductase [Gammaproteobacteria bacterium]MBU2279697.1 NAD(P)H-flavin reductase [Gammaproteobacteria bacterium]MBU2427697.1 NAD(P)H-flavin reductase [Gammaproteobacteria bacterium]
MTEAQVKAASNKVLCTVSHIQPLTPTVQQVILTPKAPVEFKAGQYLQIYLSDTDKRPFSIACAPGFTYQGQPALELQIGGTVTDNYASQALAHLTEHCSNNQEVLVQVGLGEAFWHEESSRPIILLAGGTGFSYVHSIASAIANADVKRPVQLYWGLRHPQAGYAEAELAAWQASHSEYQLNVVVQEPDAQWTGRTGLVHQAVLDDHADLAGFDIYIAGPFAMVGVVRDAFLAQGAQRTQMYADAFAWL